MTNAYPDYKPSSIDWLGDIPAHWEVKKLKYIVKARLSYGANESAIFENQDHPRYLRITDFDESGVLREDTFKSLPPDVAKDYLLEQGDILFARSGATVGKTFIFKHFIKPACFAGYLIRASPNAKQIVSDYLYLFTKSSIYLNWKDSVFNQATIQNIGADKYSNLDVTVPPLAEQIAIAEYLDKQTAQIDDLVTQKRELIRLLQEERAGIINDAVTQGLNHRAPHKESGLPWLDKIPAHWGVKKLKYVANVRTGIALGGATDKTFKVEMPYIRVANVQDGYLNLDSIKTLEIEPDSIERYSLKYGDLLMNEGGDNDKLGRGCVWRGEVVGCLHQNHVFAVRMKVDYNSEWVNAVTLTNYARHYFMTRCKQSTNLASISSANIKELPILLPPPEEQFQILSYLDLETARIDETIRTIEEEINLLTEYRSALVSELVTGKQKVS